MVLPIPNLDDRTFSDLVEELRALIPRYAPEWTDHNVSDPGIMLVELFSWLTEALIYRLNRVPDASEARFLELLGARFLPAVPARFRLRLVAPESPVPVSLPPGTVIDAAVPGDKRAVSLEIAHAVIVPVDTTGVRVVARQCAEVLGEEHGNSSGKPLQALTLRCRFVVLQAFPEILPRVMVDNVPWSYTESFIGSGPEDLHFTVDPRENRICFGDGVRGKIPPEGARIRVDYRCTLGKAGNIPDGVLFSIRGKEASVVKIIPDKNVIFVQGADPTSLDEARGKVAAGIRQCWRAVTEDDFRTLLVNDPVDSIKGLVARVRCLAGMEITPEGEVLYRPGSITVVIVPWPSGQGDISPRPDHDCICKVKRVLEERRLVTSRVHVTGPGYTRVRIRAQLALDSHLPAGEMLETVCRNLGSFFDPFSGGPDGTGWPFGRHVYPSEVYQVMEDISGVDHVESLDLFAWDSEAGWVLQAGGAVKVGPDSLVQLELEPGDIQSWNTRLVRGGERVR